MRIGDMKMRTLKRTKEEIRYAHPWAELEPRKLLNIPKEE
jgi:hypothetical protein